MTTIFNVLVFSLAILPFGIRAVSEGRIALRRLRVNLSYLKRDKSRYAYLEKFSLNLLGFLTCRLSSPSLTILVFTVNTISGALASSATQGHLVGAGKSLAGEKKIREKKSQEGE